MEIDGKLILKCPSPELKREAVTMAKKANSFSLMIPLDRHFNIKFMVLIAGNRSRP